MDHELETLWPAAEPPLGFAERVVERTLSEGLPSLPARAPRRESSRQLARRMVAVAALLAMVALVFAGLSFQRRDAGEMFAAEPRELAIGGRATALVSKGAHLEWSGSVVQQDRGAIEYQVQPGGPFVVQTPFGSVQVVGTRFEVRVDPEQPEGQSMNTKWKIAATGATLGALLFVTVHEGKVQLAHGDQQILLSKGEAGKIGADGVPARVVPALTTPDEVGASPAASPTRVATHHLSPEQQQLRDRVLDSLQKKKTLQAAAPAAGATSPGGTGAPEREGTMADKTGKLGEVVKVINHELMPMVDHCYQDALEQHPHLHGMLALHVKVTSVEGVGSIFEAVEPDATSQVFDADFIDCVRQSAFSIDLPQPKADVGKDFMLTIPLGTDAGTR
jgi:hypothetical protein